MIPNATLKTLLTAGLLTLSAGSAPQEARGRNQPPAERGDRVERVERGAAPERPPDRETTVTINFEGGSLLAYADKLKQLGRPAHNILVPEIAAQVTLPEIQLNNVSVAAALEVIEQVVPREWRVSVKAIRSPEGQAVYALRVDRQQVAGTAYAPTQEQRIVMVYSLRSLIDHAGAKADAILSAVETGLNIVNDAKAQRPVLKYHADTNLLFVQGSGEQVQVVQQTLSALRDDTRPRPATKAAGGESAGKGDKGGKDGDVRDR